MARSLYLRFRRGGAAAWAAANPTLGAGEPGYESDTGRVKVGDGATAWTGLGALAIQQARASAVATTVSLAAGAQDLSTTISLAAGYRLYSITTSRPARVRLYSSAALQAADAARAAGADPASSAGVMLDYVTVAAATSYGLSPLVDGYSADLGSDIPMTVTNEDGSSGTVTVTLEWLRTE